MSNTAPLMVDLSETATSSSSSLISSSSAPASTNTASSMSFVGNMPSTVLFFLAMAVGVAIAIIFIFFTARYFIRAKLGLNIYSGSTRGMMFLPRSAIGYNPVEFTDREIQEHLEYLRSHHFLRDDFLERRLRASLSRRRRRRRRRGRFAKMKKLSPEEVENLFPKTRYADWLSTGDDGTSVSVEVAQENENVGSVSAKIALATHSSTTALEVVELNEVSMPALEHAGGEPLDITSLSALLHAKPDLHFDSGSCSICLETFELDVIVRGLICGHVYHAECVDPWLTLRRACCPICKRDYYKEESATCVEDENGNAENGNGNRSENSNSNSNSSPNPNSNSNSNSNPNSNIDSNEPQHSRTNIIGEVSNGHIHEHSGQSTPEPNEARDETSPHIINVPGTNADQATNQTTSGQPAHGETADAGISDLLQDLNYDVIRRDANIQALFNELIPLSERVRVLLDEYPQYDMDAKAKVLSKQKRGNFFKRILWRIMGISKTDLYNWAVVTIYKEEQASRENMGGNSDQREVQNSRVVDDGLEVSENASGEALEMTEIRRPETALGVNMPSTSAYNHTEEDLADAARRRELAQDRV